MERGHSRHATGATHATPRRKQILCGLLVLLNAISDLTRAVILADGREKLFKDTFAAALDELSKVIQSLLLLINSAHSL